MNLTVVIPVFNEEKTVEKIIGEVLAQKVDKIIIVDDGSNDSTPTILEKIKNPKVVVLTHKKNMGKGAAIRTAIGELDGEYMIVQDGDLEYDPSQFGKLFKLSKPNLAVYGSRLLVDQNKHAYTRTYLGNVLLTRVFDILFGQNLTDTYTCYKLLPVKVAKELNLESNGFEIEAEITAKLAKAGIRIIEVPIKFKPRSYEEGKKIKAKDTLLGLWTYFKIRFW